MPADLEMTAMSKLHTHRKYNLADTPAQLWRGAAQSRARRSTLAASVPVLAMILAGAGLTVPVIFIVYLYA